MDREEILRLAAQFDQQNSFWINQEKEIGGLLRETLELRKTDLVKMIEWKFESDGRIRTAELRPVLRVLVANITRHVFTYLLIVWFVGLNLLPVLHLFGETNVSEYFFVFSGYLGCYLLGAYLRNAKWRSAIVYGLLALGMVWTILGNFLITINFGEKFDTYVLANLTGNTLVTAAALFLILTKITYTNPLFSFVSKNTLTIYLFHVMILEAFQNGYFGFVISTTTLNLAVEIPLMTAATLIVTTLIIIPFKKVPLANKLIC
jgi:surface polysaccharide O-acyltransferase-like enzyme